MMVEHGSVIRPWSSMVVLLDHGWPWYLIVSYIGQGVDDLVLPRTSLVDYDHG